MMTEIEKQQAFAELLQMRGQGITMPCPCDGCRRAIEGEARECLFNALACDPPGTHVSLKLQETKFIPIPDMVNQPPHYKGNKYECIDIIEDFSLGFHLGNAVKYILRAGKKGNRVEDIRKAIWYLERECKRGENNEI